MSKLDNMDLWGKRVFELEVLTVQITRNWGSMYDVAIKIGDKFEYQMSYTKVFVEEWLRNKGINEGITRINLNPALPIGTIAYVRESYPVTINSTPRLKAVNSYCEYVVYDAIDRFGGTVELFESAITQIVLPD